MTVFLRFLALLCTVLAISMPAFAANEKSAPPAPVLAVRAGVHPDFDRLVIDWPRRVAYNIRHDGNHVIITFAAPGKASWQDVILARVTRMNGFLSSTDKNGNLALTFNVSPKSTIKDFTSGDSVVIDVTGNAIGGAPHEEAAAPDVPTPPEPPENKPDNKTSDASPPAGILLPAAVPVVSAAPAATSTPTSITPPAKPPDTPTPAPVQPVVEAPQAPPQTPPPPVPTAKTVTAPLAPSVTPAKSVSFPEITDTPLLVVSLDPHVSIRAAVYQRAGFGYIVFDRRLTLSLASLLAGQPAPRVPLDLIDLPKATGYRIPLPPNVAIRATRADTAWQIFLTRQQPDVPVTASLIPQPDFALGARMLLPLPDAPEPVHMTDPIVGDDLILVPLEQTQAFSVGRSLADFAILPAAQGLVIKPLIDKLIVRAVTDGIEITAEGGLHVSTANDTGTSQESAQKAKAAAAGKSMFDFAVWDGKPGETFTTTRQHLQQTIVDVPETERDRARLELARFYFSHGNGEETVALLTYLMKLVPDLAVHADFRALDGAAKILAWRADEGLKDFDTPTLANQPEIELWQAVAQAELRNWKDAEEKFAITENMLNGYPEPFYSRFSILAIEAALAEGKDHEATDWLDRLESGRHSDSVDIAMEYLHGILDAKTGHAEKAERAWKDVAGSNDNLYRVRAKMALIDLGVSTRSLTPAQAADQLESLRFAWRGDDLELDILHRLGQFYIQSNNVKSGLTTLSKAIQLYPNSPMTSPIHDEMANIFRDVFLHDLGNKLSPLDALTLYQQYRSLMPGGTDGIAVIRNLAERLVQIDLLEQAADLLEDLVKNRLQNEEKGRVSARLAAIRLLDHKPEEAIDGLDMANATNYPADLQSERVLLRARAFSEMQKYDEALTLIKDNNSVPAKTLRAEIDMHAQRWTDAAQALLTLIGPPPAAGTPLTAEQGVWLVNCAIAVSLAGDTAGLDKLRTDYGASVAALPQNDTFRMLTEPEKSEESKDIAAAQAKITDVDMFQGFLNAYRKAQEPAPALGDAALPPAEGAKP